MDDLDDELDTLLFRESMMLDVSPHEGEYEEEDDEPPRLPLRDPDLSEREQRMIAEVNLLRQDPVAYAELLIRRRKHFYRSQDLGAGDPPQRNPNLSEGKPAVLEAIEFLQQAQPVQPIKWRDGLHLASQDIRTLIDGQETTQPTSPDQVNYAIYSYGEYQGRATQLVGFSYLNEKEVLCHLLISDGDESRHSRNILLDPDFTYGGAALGEKEKGMAVFHFITEKYWLFDEDSSEE